MLSIDKISRTIQNGHFEMVLIDFIPYAICELSNGSFVATHINQISVFDENLIQFKKVDFSNFAFGCAISNDKNIYITDWNNSCICLMDKELNIIKKFGTKGSNNNEFNNLTCICCRDDFLFVCDYSNRRIQILKLDFEYHDTIQLNCFPLSIEVSNTTIGICGFEGGIYFYDRRTKAFKKQYPNNIIGRISFIGSNFYVLSYKPSKKVYVFDAEGNLLEEFEIEIFGKLITDIKDGIIFSSKDYLFVSSFSRKTILKFKL